jgi:hypothetical protein
MISIVCQCGHIKSQHIRYSIAYHGQICIDCLNLDSINRFHNYQGDNLRSLEELACDKK